MDREKRTYILLIIIFMPLTGFGIDLYTPSFPAMAAQLNTAYSAIKMTVSIYLLGLCLGQIMFGTWSDKYGRKPTFLMGSAGFMVASLLVPFIPNIYLIMLVRFIQGFFVGAVAVNCRCLIADIYTKDEIPIASTYMTIAWSLGPIIAPLIGGYLQFYLSWKSNFYFLAGYAALISLTIYFFVRETNLHKVKHSLSKIIADYLLILKHNQFLGALILMAVGYAMLVIFPLVSPFIVQNVFHKTSVFYGRLALLIGASYLAGSLINRYLLNFFMSEVLIRHGLNCLILLSSAFLIISLIYKQTLFTLYAPMILIVISISLFFPNCMGKSISYFPKMAGKAGAVVGTGFMFLTAIISIITNYLPIHNQLSISITFLILACLGLYGHKLLSNP